MKSVSVVAAELGVDTLEGGVTVGLRLLDTVGRREQSAAYSDGCKTGRCREEVGCGMFVRVKNKSH